MSEFMSTVSKLLQILQHAQEPNRVLSQAASTIVRLTSWEGVALFGPYEEGTMLRVLASAGELAPAPDLCISIQQSIMGDVWRSTEQHYIPDVHANTTSELKTPGVSSLLLVPLRHGEGVQLLMLVVAGKPYGFDVPTRTLAQSLGDVTAMALRNARLYMALQSELAERQRIESRFWNTIRKTETLYRVSRSLNEPSQFEHILQRVVNSIVSALHADQIVLVSLNFESQDIQHFVTGGPGAGQIVPMSYDELMDGVTGPVIKEGMPMLLTKAERTMTQDQQPFNHWYKGLAAGSITAVPLFYRTYILGALIAVNRTDQPDFSQQDIDLLMAIAGQIASAIQSAQLFQTIAEERGRLRALVQSSRDGVILLGLNMHLLVINRPALEYLGLPGDLEEWVNQWFWEALSRLHELSPQAGQTILAEIRRVQEGDERPGEGEFQIASRIIHWMNLPMLGQERAVGRLFVLRDVTEARLLERFRDDLTHTMVHDLRNPLSGIYAALRLLDQAASRAFSSSQQQILDAAQRSTQRMLRLVGAILDISRLESGEMPLNLKTFSLLEIVDEVFTVQRPLAEQRGVHLHHDISEDLPQVWADKDLIDRVIQNIVGNALKFTPEGGNVRLTAQVVEDVHKLEVSISDTGTGIPPEIKDRLFQKFITGNQESRGSGLGLAFCRMVLEAHSEWIWVEKTSEQGTTITFTLSLANEKQV